MIYNSTLCEDLCEWRLDGIGDLDRMVSQLEMTRQMLTQCPYAVAFRGVMTRGEIMDVHLSRHMKILFRHLAAEIGIQTLLRRIDGDGEKSLFFL